MEVQQETKSRWRKRMLFIAPLLVVIAFFSGYIPMVVKNQELGQTVRQWRQWLDETEKKLADVRQALRVARLKNELGTMLLEVEEVKVEEDNVDELKTRSTRFFNALRETAFAVEDEALRQALMAALDQRDEITSDLTSHNPAAAAKLRAIYAKFP